MRKLFSFLLVVIGIGMIQAQTYTYTYTYDASGNRIKRTCITVTAKSATDTNAFDEQSINDQQIEKLTESIGNYKVTVFPNPTKGELNLQISDVDVNTKGSLQLFSLDGRVIYTSETISDKNLIDLSNVNPGNYILKLQIGDLEKTYNIIRK